jgi:hypothetical protein
MALKTPTFKSYDSARFYAFYKNLLELLERINEPTLADHVAPLQAMRTLLDEGYKLDQSNLLTAAIKNSDVRRDDAAIGIRKCVEGHAVHFNAAKRAAAELLLRNINKYGNVARLPYAEESAAVDSMLKDWDTPELNAALITLGIADWRTELKQAQESFDNLYLDRVQSEALKTALPISKLRPDAIKTYQTFTLILSAFEKITPATYTPIVNQINELVKKYDDTSRAVAEDTPTEKV